MWLKTIVNHFVLDKEDLDKKGCPFCQPIEYSETSGFNKDDNHPGQYIQHEDKYIVDLGHVRIFECSRCHFLIWFRSYLSEEVDIVENTNSRQD